MMVFLKIYSVGTLLAVILTAITHTQAQSATTQAPGLNATACSQELKECVSTNNQLDLCIKIQNRVSCYGDSTDHGCRVDETVVSFDDILPTLKDVCYGINNVSCFALTNCLFDTDYYQMDSAISYPEGPNQTQSHNLTSTAFWCTYLRQSVACIEAHAKTDCGVSDNLKQTLDSRAYWLAPTCDGKETSVSSQCKTYVSNCFKAAPIVNGTKNCEGQLQEMKCVNTSRNHGCDVKELMNITFDGVAGIHANICEVVNPVVAECSALRECMVAQYYGQIPALDNSQDPPSILYSRLLSAPFWCQHLNQTVNCFLREATGCSVTLTEVNAFRDTVGDYLSKLCAGDFGNPGGSRYNGAAENTPTLLPLLLLVLMSMVSVFSGH